MLWRRKYPSFMSDQGLGGAGVYPRVYRVKGGETGHQSKHTTTHASTPTGSLVSPVQVFLCMQCMLCMPLDCGRKPEPNETPNRKVLQTPWSVTCVMFHSILINKCNIFQHIFSFQLIYFTYLQLVLQYSTASLFMCVACLGARCRATFFLQSVTSVTEHMIHKVFR